MFGVIVTDSGLFAVLAELRQMKERMSMIEARLARSKQSSVHPSSEHSSPVMQTTTDQLHVLQTSENVGQNSAQINRSLLQPSSVAVTNCSSRTYSVSAPKTQAPSKTGIMFVASGSVPCH